MNERLAELRKCLNLTMEKFGARIGISRSAIGKMESGSSGISRQTILSICREFHVNYFWLTEGCGDMFARTPECVVDETAESYKLDPVVKKMIEKYLELAPEQRSVINEYLRSIFAE